MRWLRCLAAVPLLSCTGPGPGEATSPEQTPSTSAPQAFVRTCESSVYGDLGPGWRRDEMAAGPVVFVAASSYADDASRRFSAPGDRATANKVLIVVIGSRPVEVSVRDPDSALAYDPRRWDGRNRMPLEAGDRRVRFEPCGGGQRSTQFNGAVLVRGPSCVPVEVQVEGGTTIVATLSFGAGDCG